MYDWGGACSSFASRCSAHGHSGRTRERKWVEFESCAGARVGIILGIPGYARSRHDSCRTYNGDPWRAIIARTGGHHTCLRVPLEWILFLHLVQEACQTASEAQEAQQGFGAPEWTRRCATITLQHSRSASRAVTHITRCCSVLLAWSTRSHRSRDKGIRRTYRASARVHPSVFIAARRRSTSRGSLITARSGSDA